MKAVYLKKKGSASSSFEIKEIETPQVQDGTILIKVKAFGLNYADVMARLDLYPDMPPMPCILGYDVTGEVVSLGKGVTHLSVGDMVVALTRFGGYAEYAIADARVCTKISSDIPPHIALSMATQLSTAYHAFNECVHLFSKDIVLIHAAAGGVGMGLVNMALDRGCTVIAVAGSDEKLNFLKEMGVQHTINYKKESFLEGIKRLGFYKKIDVIFDSVGGSNVPKGLKALNAGGRLVIYGASKLSGSKNKLKIIWEALQFGLFSPPQFMMPSKALIGINMLSLADAKPEVVERCMKGVFELYQKGLFKKIEGKTLPISELSNAHQMLEDGKTVGKIAIEWSL